MTGARKPGDLGECALFMQNQLAAFGESESIGFFSMPNGDFAMVLQKLSRINSERIA